MLSSPGGNAPFLAAPLTGRAQPTTALRRSLEASSAEGVFAEIVGACAGGAVITGWALHFGASPFTIALLGALPFLAQLVQLPSAFLATRFGRKRVCVAAITVARQATLPLAVLPWFSPSPAVGRVVLACVAALMALAGVVANNAWVAWMGELVPQRIRGRYFGGRTARCTLAGSIAALLAAQLLDRARSTGVELIALSLLAGIGSIAGLVTTALMLRQHDPSPEDRAARFEIGPMIAPFRDARARPFLRYQIAWNAAVGVSSGLLAVHMLKGLHLGFSMMAIDGIAIAGFRAWSGPRWGRIVDRRGSEWVLVVCSFGLALSPLLWTTPDALWLVPFLLDPIVSGVLGSGQSLSAFALPLSIGDRRQRPFQLAAFATASGVAFTIAAAAGGALATRLGSIRFAFGASSLLRVAAGVLALGLLEAVRRTESTDETSA